MEQQTAHAQFSKETIQRDIIDILKNMIADWDTDFDGTFGPETKLIADLQFESIDVVQFVVAIEERFKTRNLPFQSLLMADGRYIDEITVRDTVDFLHRHLK